MRQFLWAALLFCDLVLVLLFVGGNAASYVPPPRWWVLQLIAPAVPYLGLGVIGGAVGALVWKRWVLLALHVVVLLTVIGLALAAPGRTTQDVPDDAPTLRLISFNARGAILHQYAAFRRLLGTTQPHLVAFQELTMKRQGGENRLVGGGAAGPILSEAGLEIARPVDEQHALTAQTTFSRLDTAGPTRVLAGQPAEGLWESGGVSRAVYTWDGRPVAVYNVHLHSFAGVRPWESGWRDVFSPRAWKKALRAYRADFQVRAEQARILKQQLDAEPFPFIVCGDLNSTPYTWVYAHVARGLRDAFSQRGTGWGATYPARFPLVRIDFVLASEEWVVRSARVDRTVSSDHLPVIAELVLSPD